MARLDLRKLPQRRNELRAGCLGKSLYQHRLTRSMTATHEGERLLELGQASRLMPPGSVTNEALQPACQLPRRE